MRLLRYPHHGLAGSARYHEHFHLQNKLHILHSLIFSELELPFGIPEVIVLISFFQPFLRVSCPEIKTQLHGDCLTSPFQSLQGQNHFILFTRPYAQSDYGLFD